VVALVGIAGRELAAATRASTGDRFRKLAGHGASPGLFTGLIISPRTQPVTAIRSRRERVCRTASLPRYAPPGVSPI
jgi:hypothetical protein